MSKINPLVFALGIPFVVIAVLLFVVLGRSGGKFTTKGLPRLSKTGARLQALWVIAPRKTK